MLAELGPDATADDFRTQLNLLNESIPALEAQAEQAATSDDGFKAQLRHLSSQCDFAIQILDDEKTKYLGNLSVLNQELRAKMAAAGGAFDGDWNALEATDDWPSDAAEQLHRLVENYPQVEKREGYLNEVSAYWKEFAGKEAAQLYQKGWEYVAGYKLKWEY